MMQAVAYSFAVAGTTTLVFFAALDASGWVLVIGAIFLGIGQIVTLILAYLAKRDSENASRKSNESAANSAQAVMKIEAVQHATNGMKDDLVALTALSEHAKGMIAGKEKEQALQSEHKRILEEGEMAERSSLHRAIDEVPVKTTEKVVEAIKDPKANK